MINNIKKIISIGLFFVMASNGLIAYSQNSDNIQSEIDKNNQIIEDLEQKKQEIDSEISDEKYSLEEIEELINSRRIDLEKASNDVLKFQEEVDSLQVEIDNIQRDIDGVEEEIKSKEMLIASLIDEQEAQNKLLTNRIRNYYKLDVSLNYLYLILKSESIFEAFNNISYIWKLISVDKALIFEAKDKEEKIKLQKEEIELNLEKQEEQKKSIVDKQRELIAVQKEFVAIKALEEQKLYELQALESEKINMIAALEQENQNINDEIGDLIAYNQDLQDKLDAIFDDLNNGSGGSGVIPPEIPDEVEFLRPVEGYISDYFGPRINPVTGVAGFHNGIDYAANYGVPIKATKSGVVEYSGWIEGYGNTVILDHGNGVQSLYAHAQTLLVSVGQAVIQGETVSEVGSTGMSTGPHLHFEIRFYGQPHDPYLYIPY